MTCVARVRKIPRESVETTFKICCARVRRKLPEFIYEPEVVALMEATNTPNDDTIYFASTIYERTGAELWTAYNNFALSLKSYYGLTINENNLSTIFDAMYLFHGGTSSTCKFNFVNAADTNAAFRLTFSGGWTFSGAGAQPNGTNGYANTYWESSANATNSKISYGKYSNIADTTGVHGVWDLTNGTRLYDQINTAAGVYTIGNTGGLNTATPYTRFHAIAVRAAGTKTFSDNAIRLNAGVLSYTTLNRPFYLGARNNNNVSVNQYTNGRLAFAYITGKVELSDTDVLNLNAAVDQLMLDLGRNV